MKWRLRPYQKEAIASVLNQWQEGAKSTLLNLCTSSGKTVIAAGLAHALIQNPSNRILMDADRLELVDQPVKKFHEAAGIIAGVERASERASAHAQVVIASLQTLGRRLPSGRPFTHIISDECHRHVDQRMKLYQQFPDAKIVGLTGTAFRKDLADLSDYYDTVALELPIYATGADQHSMIEEGWIVPIKILRAPLQVDLTRVHQKNGDFDADEVTSAIEPEYRAAARFIKEHAQGRIGVAFLPLIRSSQAFVEICNQEGVPARHIDGTSPDRKEILESFERREFQVLSNSQLVSTGVDFQAASFLLNLSPTRSRVEYRQRVGRILRILPGTIDGLEEATAEERRAAIARSAKPDALIIDLLYQVDKIRLCGPSSLIATNAEDESAIEDRIRRKRDPQELAELAREVQREKEEMLRQELERAAEEARKRGERAGRLMDARQIGILVHEPLLIDYEPVSRWEKDKISDKQAAILEAAGILPETVKGKGHAAKILDVVFGREAKGLAALEAFPALKAAGCANPEKMTLNQAIGMLGENYPMVFGKKWRGTPLAKVPKPYWAWIKDAIHAGTMKDFDTAAPSAYRYMVRCVFPEMRQARQEALI